MIELKLITYKGERLEYFSKQREIVQRRYDQIEKQIKPCEPYLSERIQLLNDCGRELSFYDDVIKMLEDDLLTPKETQEIHGETVMTIHEFADGLNGRDYGKELYPFEEQRAKELGFVVVFGYSDDNAEFRGAYNDEVGCFNGGRIYEDGERYINAVWDEDGYDWIYETNIPHATFDIWEDGVKYCRGIVFEMRGEQNNG